MKHRYNFVDVIIIAILLILTISCLVPVLNTLAMSFSDKTSAALGEVLFLPVNFTISPYVEIVKEGRFFRAFGVSVVRVILGTAINLLFSVFMAYPLSKDPKEFPFRNFYMWIFVFTMMFNGGLVPTFLVIKDLGLIDTIWALVLPCAVNVFNTILLMNFYKGIPKALEEAARVDGAGALRILIQIVIPLAKPALATVTLFCIVFHWNSFFDGKIYINSSENVPLQTYIQGLVVQVSPQALANMTPDEIVRKLEVSSINFNSAKAFVSMIPILLIYPFLQKYFVTGIVMGAVKE
jgi:putative aldouronate transport system permease protein